MRIEQAYADVLDRFAFNEAMDIIWSHIAYGDEFMTTREPYKAIKNEETKEAAKADIAKLVSHLAKIGAHLAPVMPQTAHAVRSAVKENEKPENLFPRLA